MEVVLGTLAYLVAALLLLLVVSTGARGSWGSAAALFLAAVAISPVFGSMLAARLGRGRAIVVR